VAAVGELPDELDDRPRVAGGYLPPALARRAMRSSTANAAEYELVFVDQDLGGFHGSMRPPDRRERYDADHEAALVVSSQYSQHSAENQGTRNGVQTATGYWLLATGYWLTGYWLLATGYWLLATGYWLLATDSVRP